MKIVSVLTFLFFTIHGFSQKQDKYWYFGTGTDGIFFDNQNQPIKLSNKHLTAGFEGCAVATDPCTGLLLFYTDGREVFDSNHNLMPNGSGMLSHMSGSQCVQICKVPGTCNQYYIISNSSWDNTPGSFYYSIVDFSTNPLGQVTIKNQLIGGPDYHQAMRIVPKSNSNNLWLIGHLYNTATYHVYEITPGGFTGPVIYNFSNSGRSWTMEYNSATQKLVNMGEDNIKVSLFDFDPSTGVLANEQQLYSGILNAVVGNFSPDGSKIYAGLSVGVGAGVLWQYDLNNSTWTNMNTCCWAHDVKTGPDGITYFIHTFNDPDPLAKMTDANLTAVGNACGYSTITNPGNFNGEVRRFPEFLQVPEAPSANLDTLTIAASATVNINVLVNDFDPQGDLLTLTSIVSQPAYGTATISGGQISYTANNGICGVTDTLIYEIVDATCMCDTAQVIIHISGIIPTSSFSFSGSTCNGNVSFTNQSQNGNTYLWNFGDGSPIDTSVNPTHTFNLPGTYIVTLYTSNNCGTDSVADSISIFSGLNPGASFTQSQINCSLTINFNNTSLNSSSFEWHFGDGYSDTTASPVHTYINAGNYTVILLAANSCGIDTLSQTILINPVSQPVISASVIQQNCAQTINVTAQVANTISYLWDFGDGNTDTALSATHTYLTHGGYTVRFFATGVCGTDTFLQNLNLLSAPMAVSQFSINQLSCSNKVTFMNQSLNATSYIWDFGDLNTSNAINPQHVYSDSGTYTVRLIAINQCGSDTLIQIVPNNFLPGTSAFKFDQPVCESAIHFTDQSQNAFSLFWDFGDGITSQEINPVHSYSAAGEYSVTLCINRGTLCADTASLSVNAEGINQPVFYIPNCFTPNGDGLNDRFEIVSKNQCDSFQFFIYDRWGNLVFKSSDEQVIWNGNSGDKQAQEGVYTYLIKSGDYESTGRITLVR